MKKLFILTICISCIFKVEALIISEVMSNPVGDDSGREWVEIYNDSDNSIDISSLTISIKNGNPVNVTPMQGGTTLASNSYAIIGSTVSSATKFLQDYPTYNGILLKSGISLVNTGITSIDIRLNGIVADILSSYTAAKEGYTLSRINGNFVLSNPTPGNDNQVFVQDVVTQSSTTTDNQSTIAQATPPQADIVLYMPTEKIVVAGQETEFSVFGLTRGGKVIDNLKYTWAYGDGGQGVGSTTVYRYAYPGKYIVLVEGGNGYVIGTGRMSVKVVTPEIFIEKINNGKYGNYIDISNPNNYDLDFSQWKLSIDGAVFPFPKNTLIAENSVTHISSLAMGFASTTISTSTIIKILFPNMEEVTRYQNKQEIFTSNTQIKNISINNTQNILRPVTNINTSKTKGIVFGTSTSIFKNGNMQQDGFSFYKEKPKDKRIISFFKSIFSK